MQGQKKSSHPVKTIRDLIYALSRKMAVIAALCLAVMMLLTVTDVAGRYFFKTPINGAWELISLLLVCAGTWGLAYCQAENAHISVNILLQKFSPRLRTVILSLAYLIGLTAFSGLTWRGIQLAYKFFNESGHTTDMLHIPIFPFVLVMAFGTGVMALVLLIDLIQTIGIGKEILHEPR